MKKRIMRYLDHVETNEYGYEVLVLACGHRFTAHQTGRQPTAKQHRQWQWCTECSRQASDSEPRGDETMAELPWQNHSLCVFARAAQEHPDWGVPQLTEIAADAEQHAIDREAETVQEQDVRYAIGRYGATVPDSEIQEAVRTLQEHEREKRKLAEWNERNTFLKSDSRERQ